MTKSADLPLSFGYHGAVEVARLLFGGSLAVSLGCSPEAPVGVDQLRRLGQRSRPADKITESALCRLYVDLGDRRSMPACSTEWDCGVGERCLDGLCTCLGCACQSPASSRARIAAPESIEDEVPVSWTSSPRMPRGHGLRSARDLLRRRCVETTACVEHEATTRTGFRSDQLASTTCARPINQSTPMVTPVVLWGLAHYSCQWLQVVPSCADVPRSTKSWFTLAALDRRPS